MSVQSFHDMLTACVASLRDLPGVKGCDAFGGRFDQAALERFGAQTPQIRVAVLRIPSTEWVDTGEFDAVVEMAAFIVTRDEPGLSRDLAALRLVQQVMVKVHAERWGQSKVHPGRGVRAENIYSSGVQKGGVALWGVTWQSKVRIGEDAFAAIDGALTEIWLRPAPDGEPELIAEAAP